MKKAVILIIAAAVIAGLLIISRKNPEIVQEEKLTMNENQLEPYLNLRGWEVSFIDCSDITIPNSFTGSFKTLADTAEKSGFDISDHKGESVKRFTYSVDNYGESGVIAELLLTSDNELISAVLIQQKPDGFIKAV